VGGRKNKSSTPCDMMTQMVWVCCSVLQCVAVCCSVLQCVAGTNPRHHMIYRLQWCGCVAMCCNVLQCVAVCVLYRNEWCGCPFLMCRGYILKCTLTVYGRRHQGPLHFLKGHLNLRTFLQISYRFRFSCSQETL